MKSSETTVTELDNHSAPQRFVRVRLTWASYWMFGYFAFLEAVLGPLMPFIRGDLHLSYLLASLHFSAFALGAMAMGTVGDRLTRGGDAAPRSGAVESAWRLGPRWSRSRPGGGDDCWARFSWGCWAISC